MDLNVLVGRNVRQRRLAASLSQEELAHRSGLSIVYVSQIENGHRNPTVATLEKLAAVFDVNVVDLFSNSEARIQRRRF